MLRTGAIIVVTAMVVAPSTAFAVHLFDDVPDDSTHAAGIEWAVDNGITLGCGDGTNYCPGDAVTRGQMATFLHRISGHAPGVAPSVDADTVDGFDAAELMGDGAPGPAGPPGAAAGFRLVDGAISRSFNNFSEGTVAVDSAAAASVEVDMSFDVTSRIVLCSVDTNAVATRDAVCTVSTPGGNIVRVRVWDPSAAAMVSNASEVFVAVVG